MSGLISWLNLEFWGPVWPNLAASAICATAAVVRIRVHLARHRESLARQHAATRDALTALHARLDALAPAGQDSNGGEG